MTQTKLVALAGILALTAGAGLAGTAFAQTPVAPPTWGAAIPGQCVLDTGRALSTSNLGKAASDRMIQLKAQVDAELSAESQALDTEGKQLQEQQKTATAGAAKTAWETKAQAWAKKGETFQRKVQVRQAEMRYTEQMATQIVFEKMIPQINATVTQNKCSMVVQAEGLLQYDGAGPNNQAVSFTYVNPAMDITNTVVQKLNAAGEQLPQIDRVNLEQQAAAAGARAQ